MLDYLQFKTFIAEDVLTVFYILCALLLPVVTWFWLQWVLKRCAGLLRLYRAHKQSLLLSLVLLLLDKLLFLRKRHAKSLSWSSLKTQQKIKLIVVFLLLVGLAEIFLRLMFEYLIAFMQMRESLQVLSSQSK